MLFRRSTRLPQNQTILLAGASAGMARQLALLLAQRPNRFILFARRQHELQELADQLRAQQCEVLTVCGDACREEDTNNAVSLAMAQFGRIDLALLNVGAGPELRMAETSVADIRQCMELNYLSLANFLPPLITAMCSQQADKRGLRGTIAHTNSLAGFIGLPMQGPYSAAKAAGRLLMDSCRVELEPEGLKFISLYPGFVQTARVNQYDMPAPFAISEVKGAELMLKGLLSGRDDYLFPGPFSWLIRLARVLPKCVSKRLLRRVL